jgi:Na+/melibiose symporter-like transporter
MMDVKLDHQTNEEGNSEPEEEFKISDLKILFTNKAFLYISFICVLFYSAVFPFMKWASTLMVHKYGIDPSVAGDIPGLLPLGTIALTPLFGIFLDKKGKAASIMIFGSLLLIFSHLIFAIGPTSIIMPYIAIFILGIAFSLVPASMWPSVPKIVEDRYLGSAYASIFWIQNWGLMAMPMLIGYVLDAVNPGVAEQIQGGATGVHYNFTIPMLLFASTGLLAMLFAFLLRAEDKKKGYGIELPNIKK